MQELMWQVYAALHPVGRSFWDSGVLLAPQRKATQHSNAKTPNQMQYTTPHYHKTNTIGPNPSKHNTAEQHT